MPPRPVSAVRVTIPFSYNRSRITATLVRGIFFQVFSFLSFVWICLTRMDFFPDQRALETSHSRGDKNACKPLESLQFFLKKASFFTIGHSSPIFIKHRAVYTLLHGLDDQ